MKKFELNQFIMSIHANHRQGKRCMSDYEIEKVLNHGSPHFDRSTGNFIYKYGLQTVVVNLDKNIIVTVHPGDRPSSIPKLVVSPIEPVVEIPKPAFHILKDEEIEITEAYMSGEYFKKTG